MIVCICNSISSLVVEDYARRGLGVDALRADFGLASNCGQCLTHALDMIGEVQAQQGVRQGERYAGAQRIIALAQA